jgi:hypothetical protein
MALSVDKVYRFVQFVANKESRGWISPSEFNLAAELAQIAAYSKREAVFLQTKKVLNDLRPFVKVSGTISPSSGLCAYPSDLRHFIAGWMDSDYTDITELTQAELAKVMKSTIVAPTSTYPAGVQRDNGFQLYPTSISASIRMEYIAAPTAPEWAYTVVSNRPVYASGSSTDFEFDDILFLEIAMMVLSNVGMNIGTESVTQYSMAFNAQT